MKTTEPLTPLESAFVYMDSRSTPMHFGSVGIFESDPFADGEDRIGIQVLQEQLMAKVRLIPKLTCKVRPLLAGLRSPVWVPDDAFDISNHVHHVGLPRPGGDFELQELCAELLAFWADTAVRMAPLTNRQAREMILSIGSAPLLTGYRGSELVDIDSLVDALLRLSRLAEDFPEISEMDANPLLALPAGAVVVDARMRLARFEPGAT